MNEMFKPEMMRDFRPGKNPEQEAAPESGVRRSAEPRGVEKGKDDIAKADAQRKMEEAFFARGEAMDAAHTAGETLPMNAAEKQAAENDTLRAEREMRAALQADIDRAAAGVKQAAEYLRATHHVDDPMAALAERATGGTWGKIKGFFGRIGKAELQAKERALDTYDRMGRNLAEMQARANEMDMRLNKPMMVRESKRISAERGPIGKR